MILIDCQLELDKFCRAISEEKIISIDTEFERSNTYYAKLSLIQIVSKNYQIIIDVLAKLDLTPFRKLLQEVKILKIFHASRQDFEILYNIFGEIPLNIFDTQIGAKVIGFGESLSYADLCWQICKVKLDKTNQFSNWLKRPLSTSKLNYAINDVLYLEKIYEFIQNKIKQNGLEDLYSKELVKLMSLDNYKFDVNNAWKKVKFKNISKKFEERIKQVAAFREEYARLLDIPRRHLLTDEELINICKVSPINNQQLEKINIKSRYFKKNKLGVRLQELCLALKEDEF